MKKIIYENQGSWSGFEISISKTGFIIEYWSRMSGERTEDKYLYQYDDDFPPNTDFSKLWNDYFTYGEALAMRVNEDYNSDFAPYNIKCLNKGYIVF